MKASELREKYLKFFENSPRNHKRLGSFPLVPRDEQQLEGKEKVLFTSAGMQPLIPYLTGKEVPPSKRLVDCQKCLRTDDIEEVGDLVHHTFFEMLGNWSIGDYWKEDTIAWSFEFLTDKEWLGLEIEKLAVSVFAGDDDAPRDEESAAIWLRQKTKEGKSIPKERIFYLGKEHNWWPTAKREEGSKEFKEPFGPCGPDTEMFYWTGEGEPEGSVDTDGRWVEIWNDVFMEYNRKEDRTLEKLPMQCVDTGMGLERALAVLNGKKSAYETDLFEGFIQNLEEESGKKYGQDEIVDKSFRITADHLRASCMLIAEGLKPGNKYQEYVLRRLLRRSMFHGRTLGIGISGLGFSGIIKAFHDVYDELQPKWEEIDKIIDEEGSKFQDSLDRGLKKLQSAPEVDGSFAFDLYQSYGFPLELTEEILKKEGREIDRVQFEKDFRKHQEVSRGVSIGEFKGGLADHSDISVRGHTATHLLHQALRDVLGDQVHQSGSNITPERIRFDFSFNGKPTEEQIKQVEDTVNSKIQANLAVKKELISQEEADKKGAIGLFRDKYADKVSIYQIGDYSTEYCGGPHVEHTSLVGKFKIVKEESISAGQRRIKAVLE